MKPPTTPSKFALLARLATLARAALLGPLLLAAGVTTAASAAGTELAVVGAVPAPRSLEAGVLAPIVITFDRPVDAATVDTRSVHAFGRWSGPADGTLSVSDDGLTVTLDPHGPFTHGETVMVVLSNGLRAEDGSPLRPAGYSYQYWTRALPAALTFVEADTLTTRTTPGESSRAYGGVGCDMNHDGFLDLTIVNEDTADLRTFLNHADGSGTYAPFMQPTDAVGNRASPNEPTDFDRDGNIDLCVADIDDDTVSIVLGNGDGTFGRRIVVPVGRAPRGICVLDVDGDGDLDIVNTNALDSNLSLIRNTGDGTFAEPVFFEGGGAGEWALAAADMNEDGILDLVVGARSSQEVIVHLGRGDGTFTAMPPQDCGGSVWMLACGDVDGDGDEDVAVVNSSQNTGAILRGNGDGTVGPPQSSGTDSFPLATDLADLDGDGDLDWVTSSFAGDWILFTNDGEGQFTFAQEFDAPDAASCSLPIDMDDDGDLDLALIDELEDVVILMHNQGAPCPTDLDGDGSVGLTELLAVLANWGPCDGCRSDVDEDGVVAFLDLLTVLGSWGPC